jgi:hypothetical protein
MLPTSLDHAGARSTAGREGPVVGRPVRLYGSRPLLPSEITEHWEMVKGAAVLRWQAARAEQLDEHADCLGQLVRDGLEASMQAVSPLVLSSADLVEPQPAAVEAVKGSRHDVHLVSSYSAATADLLTHKLGLQHLPAASTLEHQDVVLRVAQLTPQYDALHVIVSNVPLAAALANTYVAADQAVHVWVADWALPTIGLQAKVKRLPNVQLLSETQLADIMGVTHLRVVMDGISWE